MCIVALIIFFMIWEGRGFAPKKESNITKPKNTEVKEPAHSHVFAGSEEKKSPSVALGRMSISNLQKEAPLILYDSQERLKQQEKSIKYLLSKIYLKFSGEDKTFDHDDGGNDNAPFQKSKQALENVDADGAFGYRFKLEDEGFCATPIIGYLLNIHFEKQGSEQEFYSLNEDQKIFPQFPFSRMLHWKGPYIGFNAAMHVFTFLSIDASYSFHLVDFHHLFYDEMMPVGSSGNETISILRHYSNIGLGHTGLLGFSFVLGTKWKLGINCKYKQFGPIESASHPIQEIGHASWQSFQATGELGVKF